MSRHCGCETWVGGSLDDSDCLFPALQKEHKEALADRDTWKWKYKTLLDKSRGFPAARYAAFSDYAEKVGYKPHLSSQTPEGVVMDSLDAALETIRGLRVMAKRQCRLHYKDCVCSDCTILKETEPYEVR